VQQISKSQSGRYISVRVPIRLGNGRGDEKPYFRSVLYHKRKGREQAWDIRCHGVIEEHHGFISVDSKVGKRDDILTCIFRCRRKEEDREGEKV